MAETRSHLRLDTLNLADDGRKRCAGRSFRPLLVVRPTAKMHLSVKIIRLSNVYTEWILNLNQVTCEFGKPQPTRIVTSGHATKRQARTVSDRANAALKSKLIMVNRGSARSGH